MTAPADIANALPRGYALHEYRIESVLGAGGFGITYLAADQNLNAKVALKEYLPADYAIRSPDQTVQPKSGDTAASFKWGLTRFMDEARALASFHHPNIVRVMRFFETNKTGYMVMEFVDGQSLADWAPPQRPLARAAVLDIAERVLDGLDVIHRGGYLHRDIKPANIFLRADGSPVLIDFGSARRLDGEQRELTAIVSAGYAPLEQYHAHGKQGPWSDLYALGGVLYWLVTGEKPLQAAARVREDFMVPAMQAGSAKLYGADLLAAIDWALKPNETERPQSVAEFRRVLGMSTQTVALDRTVTVAATTVVSPPSSNSGLTGVALDVTEVKRLEADLARTIGPIATVLVRKAAKNAVSIAALAQAVAGEITDDNQRAAFVRKFVHGEASGRPVSAPPSTSVSQKFSAETLTRAETALAQYIGAIAKVVVRQAAAKARDEAELYLLIADEIASPSERQAFVRKAISVSGKH